MRLYAKNGYTALERAVSGMNVMEELRQLERLGFAEETLDRAVAMAGASRLAYRMLHQAVAQGRTPAEALGDVEQMLPRRL